MTYTRPDIAGAVKKATKITLEKFKTESIRAINSNTKQLFKYPYRGILKSKPDKDSLHNHVYTDESFASNLDFTKQLGYIVLLCAETNNCNILHYSSHKRNRVFRSVLGGEKYSFADGMDFGITIKHDMEKMFSIKLPIKLCTYLKSIFEFTTKNTTKSEKG